MVFGGPNTVGKTELWNGSTWTETTDLAVTRELSNNGAGASSQSGLASAGFITAVSTATEEWSTTQPVGAWATTTSLNSGRYYLAASNSGPSTDLIAFGGSDGSNRAYTEKWNGSTWTEVNDLTTARQALAGAGTSTSALGFGGNPNTGKTEEWNGTSWTEKADLNTARNALGGIGSNAEAALGFGGTPPGGLAVTESWNGTSWSEVHDLNTAREWIAGAGEYTAGIGFGGSPPTTGKTESWNGTCWTEVFDLNLARSYLAGAGTQTDAIAFGGYSPPNNQENETELWNGVSWQETSNLNTGRYGLAGGGNSTAALAISGYTTTMVASVESWTGATETTKTISTD